MRRLKLDFMEPPKPVAVTPEGFHDYEGIASIYDTVLPYPREAPAVLQYRPASALDDSAIASGVGKPIVNSHPRIKGVRVWVTPKNATQFTTGTILNMWREDSDGKPQLHVLFRVYDQQLIADIAAGKVDLSPGYDCKTVRRSGVTPEGEHYDAVQEGPITFNHLAVEYRGRNPGAGIRDRKADGDDTPMEDILALIKGTLKPEEVQVLLAELKALAGAGVTDALPAVAAAAGGDDLAKRLGALEARVTALEATKKTDSADVDQSALADKLFKSTTGKLQNLSAARELATPVLGKIKADACDDAAALHRDVVAAVWPEQAAAVAGHYERGETATLSSLASAARAQFNKKLTTDAADHLSEARHKPADRKQTEAALAVALDKKKES